MKTTLRPPPFLLGAGLLFWGWQSHLLLAGAVMAVGIESARWIRTRWDFAHEDFNKIWYLCTLLLLATCIYAFTSNEGPSYFGGFFHHPDLRTERGMGTSMANTIV